MRSLLRETCVNTVPGMFFRNLGCNCDKFGTLTLSWTYKSDRNPQKMNAVTGYVIEVYSVSAQDNPALIKKHNVSGEEVSKHTFSSISTPGPVAFKIAAKNSDGVGDFSDLSSNALVCAVPSMPRSVPHGASRSRTSLYLTWPAAASNGSAIKEYIVFIREEHEKSQWQESCRTQDRATTVEQLKPGTLYVFRVSAVNAVGVSEPSLTSLPMRTAGGTAHNPKRSGVKMKIHAAMAFK